jgi:hypothetical protein
MANRSVVDELWDARSQVWKQDDRRRAADDAVWQILQRPHSDHEYLTAQLEVAHAHMVGRDLAERAVMAVLEAPRPLKRDVEEARRLLGEMLTNYGWHRGALEHTVAYVRDRQEEEAVRRASRAATPVARVQSAVTAVHAAHSSGRSLV